jgi:hypothetical protein
MKSTNNIVFKVITKLDIKNTYLNSNKFLFRNFKFNFTNKSKVSNSSANVTNDPNKNSKTQKAKNYFGLMDPTEMEVSNLKFIIQNHKFMGKVVDEKLVLDEKVLNHISKNCNNEQYYDVFSTDKKYYKPMLFKILLLIFGGTILYMFVYRNEFITNYFFKSLFFIIGSGILLVSTLQMKMKLFSYINKISIHSNLSKVKLEIFPNRSLIVNSNDIYLSPFTNEANLKMETSLYIVVNCKKYHLPLENTNLFDKELLPLVLRGYNLTN